VSVGLSGQRLRRYQIGNIGKVKVVGAERILAFARKHLDSRPGLDHWNQIVNAADWKTLRT
jgi:hypothetical protein